MTRKTILSILLCLLVLLVGCMGGGEAPPPVDPSTPPVEDTTPTYNDPTHKSGTYRVSYTFGPSTVVHFYDEGEIPDPPTFKDYHYDGYYITLTGWAEPLVPVTQDASYTATYDTHRSTYVATFITPYGTERVTANCLDRPVAPEVRDYQGAKFVTWYPPLTNATHDTTHTAVYGTVYDGVTLSDALNEALFRYSSSLDMADNQNDTLYSSSCFLTLVIEEHSTPMASIVRDRVVEHIEAFCAARAAPNFDACCLWAYPLHTAGIALSRQTPTIWSALSPSTKERLDTMMEAFAYVCSFATSDHNDYHTGPSLGGNYYREWNPNYRFSNVPTIVYAASYFGCGNYELGAKIVNEKLKGFDEAEYDRMIGRFRAYGWSRAASCWSKGPMTTSGGTTGKSSKELLISGGLAVGWSIDGKRIETLGNGKGVSGGGKDYLYHGYTLYQGREILRDLVAYNYSGGRVTSEHWWNGKRVAWIVDGSRSPYEGQEGMMKEFNSGNRSSTAYCEHDFIQVIGILYSARLLGIYDYTADPTLFAMIQVGNDDFLYKNKIGYMSYSTGSYGESWKAYSEKNTVGYRTMKYLWLSVMRPIEA